MSALKIRWGPVFLAVLAVLWMVLPPIARGEPTPADFAEPPASGGVELPKSVPDPIEPFNRAMWGFNKALMTGVIKPTSKVYRLVVVKPVRTGIGNFGRNLTYPGRLINNLLQGKWGGARDESWRFACNTTVGVAGFFDVATRWKILKSDADFGQTFGQWGWKPKCYLMLPIFGPSNERDTVGLAADTAANPLIYIAPYHFVANNPLTYLGPYSYLNYAVMYNDLSDSVGDYVRFSQAEMDPYSEIQYAWTFVRENRVANFQVKGKQDEASLETLDSVFFTYHDPEFPGRGTTRSVLIPATGTEIEVHLLAAAGKSAGGLYRSRPGLPSARRILPGAGRAGLQQRFLGRVRQQPFQLRVHGTRLHRGAAAPTCPWMAATCTSALTEIDHRLNALRPGRLGGKALMGYSLGAFESLYIAATQPTNHSPSIKFDRYVAINPPCG